MKLPLSVVLSGIVFFGSVWVADTLRAAPEVKAPAAEASKNPLEGKAPVRARSDILKIQPNDVILGKADAPVTLFEYSSLSCPHCAHFHKEILPPLQKKYIDTGKLALVMRQFPTNAPALQGAMLVRCVTPGQGVKFEEVLFELQERWAFTLSSRDALQKIAAVGGLSEAAFNACLDDKAAEKALLEEIMSVRDNLNVKATPTFFIGEEEIDGAQEVSTFEKAIDARLNPSPVPVDGTK